MAARDLVAELQALGLPAAKAQQGGSKHIAPSLQFFLDEVRVGFREGRSSAVGSLACGLNLMVTLACCEHFLGCNARESTCVHAEWISRALLSLLELQ